MSLVTMIDDPQDLQRQTSRRRALRLSALCVLTIACSSGPARPASSESPLSLVRSLYANETNKDGPSWSERAKRPQWFTASVCALWTRAERKPPEGDLFDFDLATDTNGLTLAGYDPKVETQDASGAVVAVTIRYKEKNQPARVVRYKLVRIKDAWRIDDMSTTGWSLRRTLGLSTKP